MRRIHHKVRSFVLQFIDLFYPLFKRFMPIQMYRYAACGGGNTVLNILIYFITYNFVLKKQVLDLGFIAFTPHIAAFLIAFCFTFPIGFYLSMYVVFQGSILRRRVQLFRYFVVAMVCIVLNYVLLKLLVEKLGWYPTPSLVTTTGVVVLFSYLSQRHFSFKKSEKVSLQEA
jgi:putative flippase GtrA